MTTKNRGITPLNADTFDIKQVEISDSGNEFADYGFTKYHFSDKYFFMLKLKGLKVIKVYPPKPEDKNPKHTVLFSVSDKKEIKLLQKVEKYVKDKAFEKKAIWFSDSSDIEEEDIEALFKNFINPNNSKEGEFVFSVSFPFNNEAVNNNVKIHYKVKDKSTLPDGILDSTDLVEKLSRNTVVDIHLQFLSVKVDNTNEFKLMTTIYKQINVIEYGVNDSSSKSVIYPGRDPADVANNVTDIDIGTLQTNDKQGKFIKPKISYTDQNGEKKLASITLQFNNIEGACRKQIDKEGKTNFTFVYNITPEHKAHLETIGNHIRDEITKNKDKIITTKTNAKLIKNKFKNGISSHEDYGDSVWFSVYARENDDGTFSFGENSFTKPDGTPYTDEQIENDIFGRKHTVNLKVYLKHVWFAKFYSTKYAVSNITLDLDASDYDLGDEPVEDTDVQDTEETKSNPSVIDSEENDDDYSEEDSDEDETDED